MAADGVPFDWCSFYALFWNDKGIKCKINIPDTVLFRYGQLSAWWSTNKEGCIQRHTSQSTSLEAIRKRFLEVAQQDNANYSKFVCISWLGSGKPQLLRVMAFNQLCELLSDRVESGRPDTAPEVETPAVMQAFIQPWQDLRYVTTYLNTGTAITCHTFQRKYSRRYTPMSAASAAQVDARDADIILAVGEDADARRAEIDSQQGPVDPGLKMQLRKLTAHLVKYIQRAHGLTLGGIVCEYVRDADGKVYLMSVLRTEWTTNAAGHGAGSLGSAVLQAPVMELAGLPSSASSPAAELTTTTLTPQPPTIPEGLHEGEEEGEEEEEEVVQDEDEEEFGGELLGYQQQAAMEAAEEAGRSRSPAPSAHTRPAYGLIQQAPPSMPSTPGAGAAYGRPASPTGALTRPMTARPTSSRGGPGTGDPLQPTGLSASRSVLAQYPGGQSRLAGIGLSVSNTWPSQQHETALSPASPSSTIPAVVSQASQMDPSSASHTGSPYSSSPGGLPPRARSAGLGSSPAGSGSSPGGRPASSPTYGRPARAAQPVATPTGMPGGATLGFGSSTHRSTYPSPNRPYSARTVGAAAQEFAPVPGATPSAPVIGALTARGQHVNHGLRGAPLLLSQLQQEVEVLRDQLLYQHELAEANAAKVRQLERESQVVTTTFDNRQHELQHLLEVTRQELSAVRNDRDQWQQRCLDAEARASELSSARSNLNEQLATDRATTMAALKEYQDRDASQRGHIEQLESEVQRLSTNLKMETTAVNSLKRQLLEFSEIAERNKATLRDSDMDPALTDVMSRTGYLLAGQANPTGEQYAIQKILQHYHSDLRAAFLFYCQLTGDFTDHWPPSMGFTHWMLFCRDSETTDPRSGARVRSNVNFKMLQPAQCEELFNKFSRMDEHAARLGKSENVLTYESFLCCLVAAAALLKRPDLPFLSEALRDYVLRYLSRARRVTPHGLGRGMLRTAVEGTSNAGVVASNTYLTAMYDSSTAAAGPQQQRAGAELQPSASVVSKKSKRIKPAGGQSGKSGPGPGSVHASRPGSAAHNAAAALQGAGNSAVMKELALLSLSGPTSNRDVIRTGGGFALA